MNIETLPARKFRQDSGLRRELPLEPGNAFVRCLTARTIAAVTHLLPEDVAAERWPNDKTVAQLLTRSASAPAMTGVAGWAAELIHKVIQDALAALGPASAGALLFNNSTVLSFDRGIISAPGIVASAANAGFVAEGAPIPVRQLPAQAVLLSPFKLAAIATLTFEMLQSSNAEMLIGDTLLRAAGAALDVNLFDQVAGNAVRPSGLRNGIAASTASVNTDAWAAYFEDSSTLINAVSQVGGNGPFVVIANPGRATEMHLRSWGGSDAPFIILSSGNLGADIMIAVAPAALVCALSPEPEIETSNATTLHMNDVPQVIVDGGAMASPAKGMFQTDSIALKMRWPVTWALRDPRGVAWLTPTWK